LGGRFRKKEKRGGLLLCKRAGKGERGKGQPQASWGPAELGRKESGLYTKNDRYSGTQGEKGRPVVRESKGETGKNSLSVGMGRKMQTVIGTGISERRRRGSMTPEGGCIIRQGRQASPTTKPPPQKKKLWREDGILQTTEGETGKKEGKEEEIRQALPLKTVQQGKRSENIKKKKRKCVLFDIPHDTKEWGEGLPSRKERHPDGFNRGENQENKLDDEKEILEEILPRSLRLEELDSGGRETKLLSASQKQTQSRGRGRANRKIAPRNKSHKQNGACCD